jgi:glycosyltransferase involved in cell wall biosynthesis
MRIAQLAPLAESVPPKLYGGTERVVAWLVDELVGLGHDVTLFASGDSLTKGKLHSVWPRALRLGRKGVDPSAACSLSLEAIAKRAADFDVIHSHVDWLPLPLLSRLGVPVGWTFRDCPTSFGSLVRQDSSRFPPTSADSFRRRNGSRRSTTACRRAYFALPTTKDLTWRSWGA